ncbi:MAG: hypothetical protein GY855_12195 [candidate division Zixibacteria bacterium]|nr:hypothetical protein [candidate division Zixibacteria bacterium]
MLTDIELEELRQSLEKALEIKIRPKKIKAIDVNPSAHWQPRMYIEVGKSYANLEKDSPPEKVEAILDSSTFLVCTRERGINTTLPYFFIREDVKQVFEMED